MRQGFPWTFALAALVGLAGCQPAQRGPAKPQSPSNTAVTSNVRYEDITDTAGIDFTHHNSQTPRKYFPEIMGSGGGLVDLDNDGWLDIVLVDNRPIPGSAPQGATGTRIYRNNKDRTFTDVTVGSGFDRISLFGMGISAADYDNDGLTDVYISGVLDGGRLLRNNGGFKFTDVTRKAGVANPGHWGTSCAWFDYDKDGSPDLFVANYVKYRTLADDQPCFAGDNQKRIYCIPSAYEGSACRLYRNNGDGTFADATGTSGIAQSKGKSLGVTVWDVDSDGWLDVFVANDTTPGYLFHNQKNGTFREIGVEAGIAYSDAGIPHSGMGIDTADILNNGKSSLLLTNYYGQETNLYHQIDTLLYEDKRMEAGVAAPTNPMVGFGVLFADVDNDGLGDIFQMSGHVQDDVEEREPNASFKQPALLLRNRGNAVFEEVGLRSGEPFSVPRVGRGAAAGDIDNDGRIDLLITENNGRARLWRNNTEKAGHWLTLRLQAATGSKQALGAEVRCLASGTTQRRLVRTGSSYLSQSDLRVHFGLGDATSADLEIRWPSGKVEKISGVAVDRIGVVVEGSGKVR